LKVNIIASCFYWQHIIISIELQGFRSTKKQTNYIALLKNPLENFTETIREWERGIRTFAEALERTGLKEATFYNRLRELRAVKE
jgi:hypothetical protein